MNEANPWDTIATPSDGLNVLLVRNAESFSVNWGRNPKGQCLLVVELTGDHRSQYQRDAVNVRGVQTDLRQSETAGRQNLILALDRALDQDLFLGLCRTLITALLGATDPAAALGVCLTQLRRWKVFLSGKNARLLSAEEVRGLFAELRFLDALLPELGERGAVEAWCGADRIQHDFVFRDQAVEIKAISGRERNAVRISSEDQLETSTGRLFLRVYRLATGLGTGTESLNALVARLLDATTDIESTEGLERRLADYGYARLDAYDFPQLSVTDETSYLVMEQFPKLIRSTLPAGIARVSYDVELEAIKPFICNPTDVMGEV